MLSTQNEICGLMDIVESFILVLPVKPICYQLVGSRAKGTNRPDSDWDITALYERDGDIPMEWIIENMDDETGLFFGKFDFHYFAKDWMIFQVRPELLEDLFREKGAIECNCNKNEER